MNDIKVISIRKTSALVSQAADYLSTKWGIDRKIYIESLTDSLTTDNPTPRWFLMFKDDEIIGSYGLIENDFMARKDLTPWLCALYVEELERRKGLGGKLLAHGLSEAAKLGFEKVYLCTDHIGYYERYAWRFFGMETSEFGGETRVYQHDIR
jgi:GNAT superfamily N-acetyltransferase